MGEDGAEDGVSDYAVTDFAASSAYSTPSLDRP